MNPSVDQLRTAIHEVFDHHYPTLREGRGRDRAPVAPAPAPPAPAPAAASEAEAAAALAKLDATEFIRAGAILWAEHARSHPGTGPFFDSMAAPGQ